MKKDKIVVTGIYTNSYKDVVNLQIHSCKDDYKFDYRYITDEEWQNAKTSKDFAFWGGNIIKTQLVIDKIKENFGGILLVCDADLIFLKPTEKQIRKELKHFDTLFLQERFDKKHQYEKAKANINIGFVAIKCNERNLNFWEEVQAKTQQTHGWDQEIANEILLNKNYNLKWKHFSQKFANGNDINRKNIKKVFIGTSCGTIATRNKLTKVEYLQRLIKYSNSKNDEWFDGKTSLKKNKPLEYIFSVKNTPDKKHKILTFVGIKIKLKNNKFIHPETVQNNTYKNLYYLQKSNIQAAALHPKTFGEYRNKYNNKKIVILGCGPTLKYYSQISEAIHIGVNRAFFIDNIKLDYLFIQDKLEHDMDRANEYQANHCQKFYGIIPELRFLDAKKDILPVSNQDICAANAKVYILEDAVCKNWANNLEIEPIGDWCGCIFSALQFALYTNPKEIYIVGCDCNSSGHFYNEKPSIFPNKSLRLNYQKKYWIRAKQILEYRYPKTKVISINPVGLRGLFKDVYTQSYVDAHPELKNENIEILKPELCETAQHN